MLDRLNWLNKFGHPISEHYLTEYKRVVRLTELARNHVLMVRNGLLPPGKGRLYEVQPLLQEAKSIEISVLSAVLAQL